MKGQMEMIGLVFIVVLLVFGIMLYVRFSDTDTDDGDLAFQGATSFLVALKETSLCGTSFERVAAACIEGDIFCSSGDPCFEALVTMERVASEFLQQYRYNLSIEGTGVEVVVGCESGDPTVLLAAAPKAPIVLSRGTIGGNLVMSICR